MQCIGMVVGYVGSSGMVFLFSDFLFFIFLNFDCVHLLLANCELEILKANEVGVLVIADLVVDLLSFCNLKNKLRLRSLKHK